MNFRVEIFVDPVAAINIKEVKEVLEEYGMRIENCVSHVEDREVVFSGVWRLDKVSQVHLKHWAVSGKLVGRKIVSRWRSNGLYIEHNNDLSF